MNLAVFEINPANRMLPFNVDSPFLFLFLAFEKGHDIHIVKEGSQVTEVIPTQAHCQRNLGSTYAGLATGTILHRLTSVLSFSAPNPPYDVLLNSPKLSL